MSRAKELLAEVIDPRITDLQNQLRRANRKIAEQKDVRDHLARVMGEVVKANMSSVTYRPIKAQRRPKDGPGREHVAALQMSDWQLGKRSPGYDWRIAQERLDYYGDKVEQFMAIHRKAYPIRKAHIWLLGDMVEGELIFPGQASKIDEGLYQQIFDGGAMFVEFIRRMSGIFDEVEVVCVAGNHGRLGGRASREMLKSSNADVFLYRYARDVSLASGETRVKWRIPWERAEHTWGTVDKIGNYSCMLVHGDQIPSYGTMPWYGFDKKVKGWSVLTQAEPVTGVPQLSPFKELACGHFHSPASIPITYIKVRVNGTPESPSPYVSEQLATGGYPSQNLLIVEPRKGIVTAEHEIRLHYAQHGQPQKAELLY